MDMQVTIELIKSGFFDETNYVPKGYCRKSNPQTNTNIPKNKFFKEYIISYPQKN
jgi:hypothetical protein